MIQITNERGEIVSFCCSPTSTGMTAITFPDSIKLAIQMIHDGYRWESILNACPNVKGIEDKLRFMRAVKFYVKLNIVPAV